MKPSLRSSDWMVIVVVGLGIVFGPGRAMAQRPLGTDVYSGTGSINWTTVKNDGVFFAWAKAAEGDATDGYIGEDSKFTVNEANAKAAGVLIGAYYFARPSADPNITGANSADSEAQFFWSVASNYVKAGGSYLVPMLDWEDPYVTNVPSLTETTMSQWVNQWCNDVSNYAFANGVTNLRPVIYTGTWYSEPGTYPGLNSTVTIWPSWLASYPDCTGNECGSPTPLTSTPPSTYPWSTWNIWQYGDTNWSGGRAVGYHTNGDAITNQTYWIEQDLDQAYLCNPTNGDVPRTSQTNYDGTFKINTTNAVKTGILSADFASGLGGDNPLRPAQFTPTQTGKVIVTTKPGLDGSYGELVIYVIDMQVDANHDGVMDNLPPGTGSFQYSYNASLNSTTPYILYVHGWNMEPWEKDRFAETAYKRLYWQGYQGRFGVFRWPTGFDFSGIISTLTDSDNYDLSEYNAWQCSTGLGNRLTALNIQYPGNVYVAAHSMGNIVTGEALRLAGTTLVDTYVAMEGAVPAHCYDQTATFRTIPLFLDSGTPDRYANYPTNNGPCYFAGVAGAGKYVNFFNTNDWALGYWTTNQDLKPDSLIGYNYSPTNSQFTYGTIETPQILGFPTNTYQIFSFCDEARCYAIGAQRNLGGVFQTDNQIELDNPPFNFGSQHKYHSGQFRSDNMDRALFWNQLLIQMDLNK